MKKVRKENNKTKTVFMVVMLIALIALLVLIVKLFSISMATNHSNYYKDSKEKFFICLFPRFTITAKVMSILNTTLPLRYRSLDACNI